MDQQLDRDGDLLCRRRARAEHDQHAAGKALRAARTLEGYEQ
jgi:Protein of unknown function (DUF2630)